jgi:CheY-like chemotaxis protein
LADAGNSVVDVVVVVVADRAREATERLHGAPAGEDVPIVVIVPLGRRGDAAAFRAAGAAAYFTKPIVPAEILDGIRAVCAGAVSRDELITRHWLRERRPTLHLLVADDAPASRRLAVRLLEKRGHTVLAVENGHQAVQMFQDHDFDVALLDLQMPGLGGLEATRQIRTLQADAGRRTPIVALTGRAMESDRVRCLEAGMDAYIAKPFHAEELYWIIERLASGAAHEPTSPKQPDDEQRKRRSGAPKLNRAAALERVDGMADVLAEIVDLFFEEYPPLFQDLEQAFLLGELETVSQVAHRLKGSLAHLGAEEAADAAQVLETAAAEGEVHDAAEAWIEFENTFDAVLPELEALGTVGAPAWG